MPDDTFTVILTHEHTDFDALASMLAAHKLYPYAVPVLPRALNRNLREFLALYRSSLPFRRQEELPRRRIDAVILVDTQSCSTIRGMRPDVAGQIIDHHPLQRELEPGWRYWGEAVGATTTMLVEEIARRDISVTPVEATLLLLGIYEDTGSLVYTATTPRDLRAAAWLLERHANLQVVAHYLHHPLTEEQRALYAQLTENSESLEIAGQTIVIAAARAPEYTDEISTLAHKLRDVYDPAGLFLLVDLGDRVQMVARSTSDAVDVGAIALQLGGGGHARAAAALIRGQSLEQIKGRLVALLHQHVKPTVTVAQIMTHGAPVTVPVGTTIAEMAQIIQRYGFEGYPVVDVGARAGNAGNGRAAVRLDQLRGIITRRQVDRAQQHGLESHTVERYMHTGQVVVTPQTTVAELQRTMIESGWGQIPVVDPETQEIIGIVTRTDLIKLWGQPPQARRREEIAVRMETALPEPLLVLLRLAGTAAEELGYPLYAVGGFVRDLLLGRPNYDVDLVVEGDAIKLARLLSKKYGGRVRSHQRFGTAKWLLPTTEAEAGAAEQPIVFHLYREITTGNGHRPPLPTSLDFATARTEFYTEPTALPTVETGSIKLDLHRRDFTINTLAIRLNPDVWGELLDFYGGERDLREGLIRVLHTHSFVDDPTRILRAVRFEQRFGFRIEQRTLELIQNSADLLTKISPQRVRHELELILGEDQPEQALRRLDQLGVTPYIHPALATDDWVVERFARLRQALADRPPPQPVERLYFAVWTYRLDAFQLAEVLERLNPRRETVELLQELHTLKRHEADLQRPDLRPSEIVHLLEPAGDAARFLLGVVTDSPLVQERLQRYQQTLRHVRPTLDGAALRRLGLPPGPLYGRLLTAARDAWLDGLIASEAEERALVERLVAQEQAAQ
ncbi:MAG: CBS domain-containing protein [Caldilineales bacterium]|nr:CBS domain-containing protein [Caldilineales bacterium]MDW8318888.1 CBS domain-containing protein [Anaerolineae bacterium]